MKTPVTTLLTMKNAFLKIFFNIITISNDEGHIFPLMVDWYLSGKTLVQDCFSNKKVYGIFLEKHESSRYFHEIFHYFI